MLQWANRLHGGPAFQQRLGKGWRSCPRTRREELLEIQLGQDALSVHPAHPWELTQTFQTLGKPTGPEVPEFILEAASGEAEGCPYADRQGLGEGEGRPEGGSQQQQLALTLCPAWWTSSSPWAHPWSGVLTVFGLCEAGLSSRAFSPRSCEPLPQLLSLTAIIHKEQMV